MLWSRQRTLSPERGGNPSSKGLSAPGLIRTTRANAADKMSDWRGCDARHRI